MPCALHKNHAHVRLLGSCMPFALQTSRARVNARRVADKTAVAVIGDRNAWWHSDGLKKPGGTRYLVKMQTYQVHTRQHLTCAPALPILRPMIWYGTATKQFSLTVTSMASPIFISGQTPLSPLHCSARSWLSSKEALWVLVCRRQHNKEKVKNWNIIRTGTR